MNRLEEFKGQERLKRRFIEYLTYYKKRNEKFPHTLLVGPPGHGKTTFAILLMKEIIDYLPFTIPTIIDSNWDIEYIKEKLQFNEEIIRDAFNHIVFIDEIHKVKGSEELFSLWNKSNFIFIGATTKDSLLDKAFLSRFKIVEYFKDYSLEDVVTILKDKLDGIDISENILRKIAEISTSIRGAESFLDQIKVMKVNHPELNDNELWKETLKLMDLDENGLDYRQRKYLEILEEYGELSLKNIASLLKTTEENVEDMVEPLLFKKKLITITSKGRSLRKESSNIKEGL
jgi:Holliday junction DNA helicase RuvB